MVSLLQLCLANGSHGRKAEEGRKERPGYLCIPLSFPSRVTVSRFLPPPAEITASEALTVSKFWELLTASLLQPFQPQGLLLPMVSLHPVHTSEIIPS